MSQAPSNTALKAFQQSFGQYLRNPKELSLPDGIPARRSEIYEDLLFNNVRGFIDSCFPICKQLLGDIAWTKLARDFYSQWKSHSPYFSDISGEFVQFLESSNDISQRPEWFNSLAHYEWIELAVEIAETDLHSLPTHDRLYLNPTLQNLCYKWPVQQISADNCDPEPEDTYLLVYRSAENNVEFCVINAVTSRLISLIEQNQAEKEKVLLLLAEELQHPEPQQIIAFGSQLIGDLKKQGIIL